jgi:2,4-dienoyl-CoA reductase-like NADH-dependent reductase (Old Yellow Enzyme family)
MDSLFEQSEINRLILPNRFIRSATWAGMATDEGACTPRLIDLMRHLSIGEVGLIITGHAYVRQDGQHSPWQLGIHQDTLIPGLQDLQNRHTARVWRSLSVKIKGQEHECRGFSCTG